MSSFADCGKQVGRRLLEDFVEKAMENRSNISMRDSFFFEIFSEVLKDFDGGRSKFHVSL